MSGLNNIGVPTHFIKRLNMREQLVRNCEIIPLRSLYETMLRVRCQNGWDQEGIQLPRPVVEYYYKR